MNIDTQKLLDTLKSSNDKKVTIDKDFFITIVEMLEKTNNLLKVEEVFNYNNKIIVENNKTIINGGVLLDNNSPYSKVKGEVIIEAIELKALMRENIRQREVIKEVSELKAKAETQVRNLNSRIIEERRLKETTSDRYALYGNSLNRNIKVTLN